MLVRCFEIIKQIKQLNTAHSKFEKQKERSDSGFKKRQCFGCCTTTFKN